MARRRVGVGVRGVSEDEGWKSMRENIKGKKERVSGRER